MPRPTDDELNRAVAEVLGVDLSPRLHDRLTPPRVECTRCMQFYGLSDTCIPPIPPYCSKEAPRRLLWPLAKHWRDIAQAGRLLQWHIDTPAREFVEAALKALGKWKEEWTDEQM